MTPEKLKRLAVESGFVNSGEWLHCYETDLDKLAQAIIKDYVDGLEPVAKIDINKRKAILLDTVIFKTPTIAQIPDVLLYALEKTE